MIYSHTTSHDPDNQARRYWNEDGASLFPFGSRTELRTFEYGEPDRRRSTTNTTGKSPCRSTSTNTRQRDGDEVVEL